MTGKRYTPSKIDKILAQKYVHQRVVFGEPILKVIPYEPANSNIDTSQAIDNPSLLLPSLPDNDYDEIILNNVTHRYYGKELDEFMCKNIAVKNRIKKMIPFEDYIAHYLELIQATRSPKTLVEYTQNINKYMTWCAETKRAFMNDDNRDMYIEYLVRCKLANKTILAYTAPLKGLFKYVNNKLNALGTHITFVSPWEGNNLNIKNKVKKRKVVLPDNEMIDLLRHAKASNSLIYAMCYMLYRFGLRLDALMTLKLSKDSFTYESKGQRSRGMFAVNNEDIRLFELHKDEFHTMTTNAKRARIIRFIEKAVEKGIISERITPHCFRHSFANKNLSEGKTHKEVSDMMNHKSFISIDSYVDCYSQITNKFEGIKLDI